MVSITKLLYLLALICLSLDFFHLSCQAADNKKPAEQNKPAVKPVEQKQPEKKSSEQKSSTKDQPSAKDQKNSNSTGGGLKEGMKVPLEPLPPPTPNDPLDWEPVGIHDNVKNFLVNNTEVEEQGRKGVDQVTFEDREPVHVDPNDVVDHSLEANYVPHFNEKKLQFRDNKEQYEEFQKVNERLEGIMKYNDEWQAAQSAIKKSYFSNLKDNEFDKFLIHGFMAVMTLFIIIVMLCLIKHKCCKNTNSAQNKEIEELDREAYDELKKEYMDRRRAKIAEQRNTGTQGDQPTETSSSPLPIKNKKKDDLEMSKMKLK